MPIPAYEEIKRPALKYYNKPSPKAATLMIEHGVGVSVERSYTLKRIDSDYFEAN